MSNVFVKLFESLPKYAEPPSLYVPSLDAAELALRGAILLGVAHHQKVVVGDEPFVVLGVVGDFDTPAPNPCPLTIYEQHDQHRPCGTAVRLITKERAMFALAHGASLWAAIERNGGLWAALGTHSVDGVLRSLGLVEARP